VHAAARQRTHEGAVEQQRLEAHAGEVGAAIEARRARVAGAGAPVATLRAVGG